MDPVIKIITLRTADALCPDNRTCTSIHAVADEPDRRYVITKKVTDPAVAAAFAPSRTTSSSVMYPLI